MVKELTNKLLIVLTILVFSASSCEEKPEVTYTSIEGLYACTENSVHSGYKKYFIDIDKAQGYENTYIISNFHNYGEAEFLYAEYYNDTLYIFNQAIITSLVNGKGHVDSDLKGIQLEYSINDQSSELEYYASYER